MFWWMTVLLHWQHCCSVDLICILTEGGKFIDIECQFSYISWVLFPSMSRADISFDSVIGSCNSNYFCILSTVGEVLLYNHVSDNNSSMHRLMWGCTSFNFISIIISDYVHSTFLEGASKCLGWCGSWVLVQECGHSRMIRMKKSYSLSCLEDSVSRRFPGYEFLSIQPRCVLYQSHHLSFIVTWQMASSHSAPWCVDNPWKVNASWMKSVPWSR